MEEKGKEKAMEERGWGKMEEERQGKRNMKR